MLGKAGGTEILVTRATEVGSATSVPLVSSLRFQAKNDDAEIRWRRQNSAADSPLLA